MKRLLFLLLLLPSFSWAQIPPAGSIAIGNTTITGGPPVVGDCLTIGSGNKLAQAACGAGSVTTFSAGSTGFTPSSATSGAVTLAGILNGANGGTGFASYAVGDLLYAATTTTLARLADVATTNVLLSGGIGAAPSWGKVANAALSNSATTVNGQTCTLGSTCTVTAAASGITIGTTTVSSGTTTRILYDNAGVLGEYTISGSGTVVAMQTGAALITPALGVATGTSLALGGATIGTASLAVPVGSAGAPSIAAGGTSGFYWASANGTVNVAVAGAAALTFAGNTVNGPTSVLKLQSGGTDYLGIGTGSVGGAVVKAVGYFGFTNDGTVTGTIDLQLGRNASGVLEISTGTAGVFGGLKASNATLSGQLNVTTMTQTAAAQSGTVCYNSGTGAVTYDATLGCLASSERFKTDIVDIHRPDALAMTMALAPVSFRKRAEFGGAVDASYHVGFIAEQVAEIDERLVSRNEEGVRGVRYQEMSAIFAGAIQELNRKIILLEAAR